MKVLMLTYDLPYPPESGGKTRAYNLIKHLSKKWEIILLSFIRHENQNEYKSELEKFCASVTTIKRNPVWTPRNLLKTCFSHKPLPIIIYDSPDMKKAIARTISQHTFDAVFLESFYTSGFIDEFGKTKIILGTETIEYL